MPYPGQVTKELIVEKAHQLIEEKGVDALSLGKLAKDLGVKAPSLYRHIGNKERLLQEVNIKTLRLLFGEIDASLAGQDQANPSQKIVTIAKVYRQYALAHPHSYRLFSSTPPGQGRPDEDLLIQLILPMQEVIAELSGDALSLTALRGLVAQMHGFVMLELNQQLQRGGNLQTVYEQVIAIYLQGLGHQQEIG